MTLHHLLLALVLAMVTAACSAPATTREYEAKESARPAASARVGLTEWSILTSTRLLSPGLVVITVTNTGSTAHNLLVRGGRLRAHSRKLRPGEQQTLRVDAPPGQTLHLSCTLPGHHQAGMHATVQVVEHSTPSR